MMDNRDNKADEQGPAVESPDTVRGGTAETAARDGDVLVQDHITTGHPSAEEEADEVDRRAP